MANPIMDNLGVTFKNDKERKEFFSDRVRNYAALQKEINQPFKIDYSEFTKSPEEKAITRSIAQNWRNKRKAI